MDLLPARLLCLCDSPGKNTGVGCRALLQGIFLTQESNTGLLHCRQILYLVSHQRSLDIYHRSPAVFLKFMEHLLLCPRHLINCF